jgi:hypothetical protein
MTGPSATDPPRCAAPGCPNHVVRSHRRGRPPRYCSPGCRNRASHPYVEVDHDPTDGRPVGRVWLVRLVRRDRCVVIARGLGRPSADYLAHQIHTVLTPITTSSDADDHAVAAGHPGEAR